MVAYPRKVSSYILVFGFNGFGANRHAAGRVPISGSGRIMVTPRANPKCQRIGQRERTMSSSWICSFRVGLLLFVCGAQVLAQNAPASVSVDANAGRHPINPNIYGFAFGSKSDLAATNFAINRSGGNGTSTYNWQINAANHANDWYFESILDPPQTPGYDGDTFITQTRAANVGAQPLLTIPMINYLAKLGAGGATLWSYSIAKYGAQTGSDPYRPDAGNGISAATGKPIT